MSNRSQNFTHNEVKALVELVTLHKDIILNKCTNSAVNHAKDEAWNEICKEINKRGFKYERTVENLKIKWINLKRLAKKVSQNIIHIESSNLNSVLDHIVMLINEVDTNASLTTVPTDGEKNVANASRIENTQENSFEAINDTEENVNNRSSPWNDNENNQSDESDEADNVLPNKKRSRRTMNFSPAECSLLLKCVREEKDNILCKGRGSSMRAMQIQNSAWDRITQKYNRLSSQKRTNKVLRTKFSNMKRLANRVQFKKYFFKNKGERIGVKRDYSLKLPRNYLDVRLDEEQNKDSVKIKDELKAEPLLDLDMHQDSEADNDELSEMPMEPNERLEDDSDLLCAILNGDSGIDSISNIESYTAPDNKEVVKLKLELLKYQLETAKLERKRIKDAIEAEASQRQSKAIEASLRLRAARLQAVASEASLPADHPARPYTEQEQLAKQYLMQFENT